MTKITSDNDKIDFIKCNLVVKLCVFTGKHGKWQKKLEYKEKVPKMLEKPEYQC